MLRRLLATLLFALAVAGLASAATYYVDGPNPKAADTNPGTAAAPWKTLAFAGQCDKLRPGDTVLIKTGVYREYVDITVSGAPGKPITFAAAPLARVVIKGSEIVKGPWTRLADPADKAAPFADKRTWKVTLGDEFFTDPRFAGSYTDKSRRWVSQVWYQDDHPLRMIGPDGIYKNETAFNIELIGKSRADLIPQSFFFDSSDQTLYVNLGGEPGWYCVEVGVRGFGLTVTKAHDVVVRGLEVRHNRQPGGQWPIVAMSECERVTVEDCKIQWADFTGMGVSRCKNCTLRRCEFSRNGAIGLAMGVCEDILVENCTFLFNNYRHIGADWGVAAGTKCIPGNKRITVRGCEAAYNDEAEGIWFDTDNEDIRLLDNVCHDNGDCGIFFEINKAGGVIAGNLIYNNHGRGIYVSGSQNTWVAHNTVVENDQGIVSMTRAADEPPRNNHVLNNLLIGNYTAGATITRGADLIFEQRDAAWCQNLGSASDYNVYGNNSWQPTLRHNWNDDNPLIRWQGQYGQDKHSRQQTVPYLLTGTAFRLLDLKGLDVAGPLPAEVSRVWKPRNPKRVGADRTEWPAGK